eukprot:TRINITY_DN105323_c0_g1_i1.p1 TRINITY_DN105323_c0_g1~~TRINITY_DN105323_c0_g1_i1.p1  ORF type:complete len:135 (-),score=19.77 TRINITY_DN105323_c0_g1_i1:117-521(-)
MKRPIYVVLFLGIFVQISLGTRPLETVIAEDHVGVAKVMASQVALQEHTDAAKEVLAHQHASLTEEVATRRGVDCTKNKIKKSCCQSTTYETRKTCTGCRYGGKDAYEQVEVVKEYCCTFSTISSEFRNDANCG